MFARAQLSAFIAVLVLGVSGQPTTTPACTRHYTVQSEDFCDKISAAQNVSTFQLASVNKAIIDPNCDNLFIGEVLCLGLQGQDCTKVAVVQPGDSCPAIAGNAGISIATLQANNPNIDGDCTNIYPGEVLCTQGSASPA